MQDFNVESAPIDGASEAHSIAGRTTAEVVSTHVLVAEDQLDRLRDLSRRTRIAQSEYLREAVDDLLTKYGRRPEDR